MSVFVTGVGIASALGFSVEETQKSLINNQSGIKLHDIPRINESKLYSGIVDISNRDLSCASRMGSMKKPTEWVRKSGETYPTLVFLSEQGSFYQWLYGEYYFLFW